MITELRIPYPDFKLGELIDPEEHDLNNLYLQNKINDLITFANTLTGEIPGGATGAELMSMKPIAPFTQTKIQTFLDALVARLQSKVGPNTGASLIGNVTLSKFPGDNVGAQLDAINTFLSSQFVTNTTIVDGAISGSKLQDFTVTNQKIANASVTNAKLGNNAVMNVNINDNAVTRTKIANGAIDNSKIENGSILDTALANGAVTNPKILAGAVTGSKIATNNIITSHLVDANVTRPKIADRAVDKTKMELLTIDDTILASGSVTNTKLGERVVTSSKIGTQQVKLEHLDPALLELLPEGQLTQKVLKLETDVSQLQLQDTLHDQDIVDLRTAISAHEMDFRTHTFFGLDTGLENRKLIQINPSITSYQSGLTVRFESRVANTGAVTIQVNSMAEKAIVKPDGSALNAGDMKAGGVYTISYSGKNGNFTLQGSGGSSLPAYYGTGADGDMVLNSSLQRTWTQTPTSNSVNKTLGDGNSTIWQWTSSTPDSPAGISFARLTNATSSYPVNCAFEFSYNGGVTWVNYYNFNLDTTPKTLEADAKAHGATSIRVRISSWTGTPPNPVTFNYSGSIQVTQSTSITFQDSVSGTHVKNYNNFTINEGTTFTLRGPLSAVVIFATGDVTINGTIDLIGKGNDGKYMDYLRSIIPSTHNRREILGFISSIKGGNGGDGGNGGAGTGANRAAGGTGQKNQTTAAGFGGGGGGGGVPSAPYVAGPGGSGNGGTGVVSGLGANIYVTSNASGGFSGPPSQGGGGALFDNTTPALPVKSYARASSTSYSFGSGSGGGGGSYCYNDNNLTFSAQGGSGDSGVGNGGILIIVAKGTITLGPNSRIHCNGAPGGKGGQGNQAGAYTPSSVAYASGGGGGGGSGGGIVALAYGTNFVNSTGTITVHGGLGGSGGGSSSPGVGNGGGEPGLPGQSGAGGELGLWKVGT